MTAEPLLPESSAFEFQMFTEKLKTHKLPGIDQIPAELMKAGLVLRSTNILIPFGIRRVTQKIVVIIETYQFCQLRTKFYPTSRCQG
jgi:hypothetical protein